MELGRRDVLGDPEGMAAESAPPQERDTTWKHQLFSNLAAYDSLWMEASGALGDLGTFVPIVVALTLVNGIDLGTTLIFTGVYNILTGLLFGVPMPVQPMKSIAAVAITQGDPLTIPQIMAAGITTAAILFILGVTRLMWVVQRLVPLSVVRGIQLSQGLAFAIAAVKYVMKNQDFAKGKSLGNREWLGLDGMLVALLALCFIMVVSGPGPESCCNNSNTNEEDEQSSISSVWKKLRRVPTALIVFIVGVVLTVIRQRGVGGMHVGPSTPVVYGHISAQDWRTGFVRAAVPQIPLSVLNSVIAVCKLAGDLFPEKRTGYHVSPTVVATSVGAMNLVGCWFGAIPVCHGAGGLAGQWKFGARSGAAVVMLGLVKVMLGLILGNSLVHFLKNYPVGILGVLLLYAGLELAMACRDQTKRSESFVVLSCAAVSIATSNAALGFAFCLVAHILLSLPQFGDFSKRCLAFLGRNRKTN